MSFNWADFLTLAEALLRDPNSPGPEGASLRSAISRAYYAAFRVARNFGRDRGEFIPAETGQDHRIVQNHFKSSPERTRKKIGVNLQRLYDYRNNADYDDVLTGNPISLAQSSVAMARDVLNMLKSL